MRILIAEDDETSRVVLCAFLKKWGHEVVVACDGNEAWVALQSDDAPPLAILDWMMPGHDGVELCRRVRQMDRKIQPHIILLTGRGRKEEIVSGLNAGADDYVTKPFGKDELRARIHVAERITGLQAALADHVAELADTLAHVKTLRGILPICMHCHKIRQDETSWQSLEEYIRAHSDAQFSHGLCDECLDQHYPKEASEGPDEGASGQEESFRERPTQ